MGIRIKVAAVVPVVKKFIVDKIKAKRLMGIRIKVVAVVPVVKFARKEL